MYPLTCYLLCVGFVEEVAAISSWLIATLSSGEFNFYCEKFCCMIKWEMTKTISISVR